MNKFMVYTAIALTLACGAPLGAAPQAPEPAAVAQPAQVQNFKPDANMDRSQIPDIYKWNLTPLFSDSAQFEQALRDSQAGVEKLQTFKGKLQDPQALVDCLELYFQTRLLTNKATLYSNLRLTTALRDPQVQDMDARAQKAMRNFMAQTAFIRDEVMKLDGAALDQATVKFPRLKDYRPWINEARRRANHILSAEEERILSLAGDNQFAEIDLNELPSDFEKAFQALSAEIKLPTITDEEGKTVQLTFSNYAKYRGSSDRRVRQETVSKFFGALNDYRQTFASLLAGQVHLSSLLAKARGYDSALAAYLDRDNIPQSVYTNIVDTVRQNTAPLHRYVSLRKKMMGLDEVHLYDLYPPLVPAVEKDITYAQACEIVPQALAPLGEKYVQKLQEGLKLENGWVDVHPHKDKDSGASCASIFGCHPFVKMNFLDSFDDMSTLAHEFGHAMHSDLSFSTQPYTTAGYVPFVAEVASTCNEKFLSDYLVAHAQNDEEKLYLLNQMVDSIRSTIYRQALFADFELRVHQAGEAGQTLSADFLNETYLDLIRQYYGPDFTIDETDGIEWAYIPHLYYKFYVFSYTAGMSSGIAIAEKVQKEGAPARDAYLQMLSSGSSKPPVELLKMAGVDLTKPQAIQAATNLMDELLDQMEEIIAKRSAQ